MGSLFNIDGGLFSFLNKVANLIILNLLCILCCIPIITAGASITAMFYVTLKMVKDEDSYIVRGFFKSFKENFKQATIIWIIYLLVCMILYFDFRIINMAGINATVQNVLRVVFLAISMFVLLTYIYVFPVLSKFVNSVRRTILNSLLMAIRHFPWTILMIVVTALPVAILYFITSYGIPIIVLAGFSLVAYINSFMFRRIFDKYIPEEPEEDPDAPLSEEAQVAQSTSEILRSRNDSSED